MTEKRDHFRAPVSDTFRRKSPFRQLLLHMKKVRKCIDILGEGLMIYYKGDYKSISKLSEDVSKIEHEADLIKRNIRNHLPKTLFMPVDKGKFLWALREEDKILDHAENLVKMLELRHTKIPKELQDMFIKHLELVVKTVNTIEDAVKHIMNLLEASFIQREREHVKEYIYKVHQFEWEADQIKMNINKKIYEIEKKLAPMDVYHLLKIADWVDDIADHSENVADWLRSMIAK
jgi:predicted phosphate transport protein (TIGR00153 family)